MLEEITEGIWHRPGSGPRLAIVAGVHGDEQAGVDVVLALTKPGHPIWTQLSADVVLIIANLAAVQVSKRAVEGQDMNRLFGLAAGGETGTRLRVIEEALADRDAVLDLHETSCDTEPLAVCADTSRHVDAVSRLGLSTIVAGASEVLGEGMLAAWVDQQGGCGVTVEVGRNGTSEAAAQAAQLAFRWLKGDASQAASSVQVWRLRGVIRALEDGTQAVRGFGNASRVSEREVVARGPTSMVRAPGNGALFLPKAQADHGRPVALFATDDGQRVPSRQRSDD